jgi:hypothetical protein
MSTAAAILSVIAAQAEPALQKEYPVIQTKPKGAFTVPEKFRDIIIICSATPSVLELLEVAANKTLEAAGFSFSENSLDSEKHALTVRYAMDPLTTHFVEDYNQNADKHMRIDSAILYSANISMSMALSDQILRTDTEINLFYYVGKQRKPYDGPIDKRSIYEGLAAKIFSKTRDLSCQK